MNKKMSNMKTMWLKGGYDIKRFQYTSVNGKVYQAKVSFVRNAAKNMLPIYFLADCSNLKKLAQRQSYYIFNITEKNSDGFAEVLLADKALLLPIEEWLYQLARELGNDYWAMQQDLETIEIKNKLNRLAVKSKFIVKGQRYHNQSNYGKDNLSLYEVYESYKKEFFELYDNIKLSDKVRTEDFKEMEEYCELYAD